MAHAWPFQLMFQSQAWFKSGASRSGGASLTGTQQVVRTDAGFWAMRGQLAFFTGGHRRGEPQVLAYRAMYAALDGMAGEIDVPCITPWRPYDIHGRMFNANAAAGFDKFRGLFDHSGFGQTEIPSLRVSEAAPLRATRLVLRGDGSEGLRPGHYFGIGHRLYLVSHAWEVAGGSTPDTYVFEGEEYTFEDEPYTFGVGEAGGLNVQFWPPLREAVAVDTPLILGRPVCRMRLATDETAIMEEAVRQVVTPTIELVEAL